MALASSDFVPRHLAILFVRCSLWNQDHLHLHKPTWKCLHWSVWFHWTKMKVHWLNNDQWKFEWQGFDNSHNGAEENVHMVCFTETSKEVESSVFGLIVSLDCEQQWNHDCQNAKKMSSEFSMNVQWSAFHSVFQWVSKSAKWTKHWHSHCQWVWCHSVALSVQCSTWFRSCIQLWRFWLISNGTCFQWLCAPMPSEFSWPDVQFGIRIIFILHWLIWKCLHWSVWFHWTKQCQFECQVKMPKNAQGQLFTLSPSDFRPQSPVESCQNVSFPKKSHKSNFSHLHPVTFGPKALLNHVIKSKCQTITQKQLFCSFTQWLSAPKPWFNRVKMMQTDEFLEHLSPTAEHEGTQKCHSNLLNCLTIFCLQQHQGLKRFIYSQFRMTRMTSFLNHERTVTLQMWNSVRA